jgi:TonB family protein
MSLSQIATQQREKEQKRYTKLLAWTVPISIALHLAALVFGGNLPRHNTQEIAKAPIEVLTIEPEKVQTLPPKLPKPEKPKLIPPKVESKKVVPKPVIKKIARSDDAKKPTLRVNSSPVAKAPKPIAPTPKPIVKNEPIAPPPPPQPPTPQPEIAKRPLPPLPPLPRPEPQPLPNNNLLTQSNPNSSFAVPSNNPETTSTASNGQPGSQVGGTGSDNPLASSGNRVDGERGTGGDNSGGKVGCLECPKPDYPDDAREKEIEGKVRVSVDIDAEGNVMDVKIASSSGHVELDEAAIDKAREWKFDRSTSGKKGMVIAINFQLEDAN